MITLARGSWSIAAGLLVLLAGGCAPGGTRVDAPDATESADVQTGLPSHPSELQFEPRDVEFPDPAAYRHELPSGDVLYVVEDHSLPLVDVSLYSPAGDYVLPPEQAGLAGMTATMLRDGGTRELTPSEVDERLEFLASGVSFGINSVNAHAGVDTLTANLDESLDLMFDMLTESRWDADRLAINQARAVEAMRRRNDDIRSIEPRVWGDLIHGEDFFTTDRATQATVERIDAAAMAQLRDRMFASGRLIIAVSGDVQVAGIKAQLARQLARLPRAQTPLPPIPDDPEPARPGLYGVDKPDVSQSRVTLGHPSLMRGHPDEFALAVMNEILGGGGFTSRIVSRVRSDEGLAYSAGTALSMGRWFPGQFRAFFQSKNNSVAEALAIVLDELERIRSEPVTPLELETAKESQIAFLADLFSSAGRMATRFAVDDLEQRPAAYWREYEERVRAVTVDDVQRVAATHLHPEQLRVLVVGKLDEVNPTATEGGAGPLEAVVGASLARIPLKDPLTQR